MSVFTGVLAPGLIEQHLWGRLWAGRWDPGWSRLVRGLLELLKFAVHRETTFHLVSTKEAVSVAGTGTGGGAPNPACRAGRLSGGTDESCLRKEGGKSISSKGAACEKSQRPRRRHAFATCQDFCVLRGEKMEL